MRKFKANKSRTLSAQDVTDRQIDSKEREISRKKNPNDHVN